MGTKWGDNIMSRVPLNSPQIEFYRQYCFDGHAARYNCYGTSSMDQVLVQNR